MTIYFMSIFITCSSLVTVARLSLRRAACRTVESLKQTVEERPHATNKNTQFSSYVYCIKNTSVSRERKVHISTPVQQRTAPEFENRDPAPWTIWDSMDI